MDIYNNYKEPVTLTYTTSQSTDTTVQIPANSESLYDVPYQMTLPYEQLTIKSKELVGINGQGTSLNIPFNTDMFAMVVLNGKGRVKVMKYICLEEALKLITS